MASTITKKRLRKTPATASRPKGIPPGDKPTKSRRAPTIANMTMDDLETAIEMALDRTLTEWFGDPDAGLELRPEVIERIEQQRKAVAAGERGKPLEQVMREYGIK